MAIESGYVLPAGNLERAAQLRSLAKEAQSPEGRKHFMRLAMLYERMAATWGSQPVAPAATHGMD
jgi:hypothetical protein